MSSVIIYLIILSICIQFICSDLIKIWKSKFWKCSIWFLTKKKIIRFRSDSNLNTIGWWPEWLIVYMAWRHRGQLWMCVLQGCLFWYVGVSGGHEIWFVWCDWGDINTYFNEFFIIFIIIYYFCSAQFL